MIPTIERPASPSTLHLQKPYSDEEMAHFPPGTCAPTNDPVLQYAAGTQLDVQGTPRIYPPFMNHGERAFILSRKETAPGVPVRDVNATFRNAAEKGAPALVKGVVDEHGYLVVQDVLPPAQKLAEVRHPTFNIRGITVTAEADGVHIRGAFPGGNSGFMPPTFTMNIDGNDVFFIDTSWSALSPAGLAAKIKKGPYVLTGNNAPWEISDKYNVEIITHGGTDVLVKISNK